MVKKLAKDTKRTASGVKLSDYEKNVAFRVDNATYEKLTDEMLQTKEFNRSKIARDIFFLGFKHYKFKCDEQ